MSGRKWIPTEWVDELNPTLLDSPDAFIERIGEGWGLRLPAGDPDRGNEFYQTAVEPGQIVNFMWTEHYGDRTVIVHPDRTWIIDQPPAEAVTHFYEHSQGVLADSIEEMVNGVPDCGVSDPLEPGEYEISTYTWSEAIPYRFDVDADGNGRFVQCEGAN